MATLADAIEAYLKQLIGAHAGFIEIRRCDLADTFACAPSQINYVLETRFSNEHGYIVESRRGGGGYIRIRRVVLQPVPSLYTAICEAVGEQISETGSLRLLGRLVDGKVLSQSRAEQIHRFLTAEVAGVNPLFSGHVRASALKGMLLVLLSNPEETGGGVES